MRTSRIHHLVVLDGKKVVGVLTDRDLGGPRGTALRAGKTAGDLMTGRVVTADAQMTVRKVANLLRGHVIGCLPVMEGERLVGIVTVSDLLDLIGRGAERPSPPAERRTLHRRGPRRQAPHGRA
jgi:acetoin utilization protein AcuB